MRVLLLLFIILIIQCESDEIKDKIKEYFNSRHSSSLSSPSSSNDICSTLPPSLWCTSSILAKQCGFLDQCNKYKQNTRNQPILITLLYESLCPGCQKFITEQLYPRVLKNFGPEFVKIELVPYGNAKLYENGTIICQHGEDECSINKFESCLISALPEQMKHVPAIHCIEAQLKVKVDFDKAMEKCFQTLDIGMDIQTMIQSCLVTHESARLQEEAAHRTDNVFPDKHDHVPWVLFNNASIADAQFLLDDIPSLICAWWSGDNTIPYCQVEKVNAIKYKKDRMCQL